MPAPATLSDGVRMMPISDLQDLVRGFAEERDWGQFHSPRNLILALTGEVGELAELFQWLTDDQAADLTSDQRSGVEQELADVFIYLIRLADVLDVDLEQALLDKLETNANRYPVEKSKGSATKYTELNHD